MYILTPLLDLTIYDGTLEESGINFVPTVVWLPAPTNCGYIINIAKDRYSYHTW